MSDPDMERFLDLVDRRVRKFGWTSVYVPADENHPPFAYTVGFSEQGKHDLIIVGEEHCTVCFLFYRLWELTEQDLIAGPGPLQKIIQDIDVELAPVEGPQSKSLARVATYRLGSRPLNLLQVLLPERMDALTSGMTLAQEEELSQHTHRKLAH